jgi:serine/threonine protein kinase
LIKALISLKFPLSQETKDYLMYQAVLNLYYLHTEVKMAHLDYKPDNLIFDEDFLLKMIDFGSSDNLSSILTRWVTTPNYAPPEVLKGNRFN